MAKKTRASIGHRKGEPIPYINGHNRRKSERIRIEDRGYRTPCHTWLLSKSKWGYGLEAEGKGQRAAHIAAYVRKYGPVPEGKELDHLCRNRDCVNPDHLEPVIRAVNIQRGDLARLVPDEVREIRVLLAAGSPRKLSPRSMVLYLARLGPSPAGILGRTSHRYGRRRCCPTGA